MTRYDRRTFLKHTARASGLAAASLALPEIATPADGAPHASDFVDAAAPGAPARLTVNGLVRAIGVDADALFFAWRVRDGRRGATQSAARLEVADTRGAALWRSTLSSAQQAFVRYGGPRLAGDRTYLLRVATADSSDSFGPFAESRFSTGPRVADWRGMWLQPAAAASAPELYRYLRTVQHLPGGTIARATAYVAAAHKYRLYANGVEVDSGPSFSYPDESYYQATDLTGHLRAGAPNVVGALHHWYGPGKGRPASAPGFLAHVTVEYANGRRVTFGTDHTWHELPGEWLPAPQRNNTVADFVENIDGRLTPLRWSEPSFDASSWTPVTVLGPVGTAPFTKLFAQRTSITETRITPLSVRTLASGAVVVDFGKVYAARPSVEFRNGVAGRTVPMHVGYLLDDDGHVSTVHGTQMTNLSYSYAQRDGAQQFVPYTYIGFRYLEIDDPGETIGADQVVALARRAAMPEDPTTFSSDDQVLDDVFALTAHSCAYTSHEQFVDTPTREKGPFLWDSAQESMAVMRLFGEQNLTFQGLRDFARSQARFGSDGRLNALYPNSDGARDYPTFTAIYAEWVWQYYLSTGDTATLESLYPTLTRVADYFAGYRDPATGLLTGVLQSQGDDPAYGFDFSVIVDTPVNILAANVFSRVDSVSRVIGDAVVTVNGDRAAALTSAINAQLTRPDGIYVDGIRIGGSQSPSATQLPNLLALAYGVVPPANLATVGDFVRSQHISVSPDHGLQLLQALHHAGLDAAVLDTLTDASRPGWASILRQGGTFTWEVWQPSDLIGDSMSHGWGSSALVAIQAYLLGVDLSTPRPGTARVTVTVPSIGLSRASGSVPTVAGPVVSNWRRQGSGAQLQLEVPPNLTATLTMPASSAQHLTEGGRPVSRAPGVSVLSVADGVVTLEVGSGSYAFTSA